MHTVAFSAVGRRVELVRQFQREIRARYPGVETLGLDADVDTSAGAQVTDYRVSMPSFKDPAYGGVLDQALAEYGVRLLIPLHDGELIFHANRRAGYKDLGVLANVACPRTVQLTHDKLAFHQHQVEQGLPTLRTIPLEDLPAAPREVFTDRVVVKPRHGSASVGIVFVDDPATLAHPAEPSQQLLVQERAQGSEFSVDLFVDGYGAVRHAAVRKLIEARAGEVSKGVSVVHDHVAQLATEAIESLPGPFGVMHADVFYDDASHQGVVLEVNARFPGGYPLSHRAGAPGVRWLLDLAMGITPDFSTASPITETTMLRYDAAVYLPQGPQPIIQACRRPDEQPRPRRGTHWP